MEILFTTTITVELGSILTASPRGFDWACWLFWISKGEPASKPGLDLERADAHNRVRSTLSLGQSGVEGRDGIGKRKTKANTLSLGWASTRLGLPVTYPSGCPLVKNCCAEPYLIFYSKLFELLHDFRQSLVKISTINFLMSLFW